MVNENDRQSIRIREKGTVKVKSLAHDDAALTSERMCVLYFIVTLNVIITIILYNKQMVSKRGARGTTTDRLGTITIEVVAVEGIIEAEDAVADVVADEVVVSGIDKITSIKIMQAQITCRYVVYFIHSMRKLKLFV